MKRYILVLLVCTFTYVVTSNKDDIGAHNIVEHALVKEVEDYISKVSPRSNLTPKTVVNKCMEHDIDIIFVLAQGQIESNFGTAGIASSTNSVWNVNSYDGRSSQYIIRNSLGYEHPDHSIEPYIYLLKSRYLTKGRTEYDLMNRFTASSGHRYASSPTYEYQLKSLYNRIHSTTNIKHLQTHLKNTKNSNGNDTIH